MIPQNEQILITVYISIQNHNSAWRYHLRRGVRSRLAPPVMATLGLSAMSSRVLTDKQAPLSAAASETKSTGTTYKIVINKYGL